MLTMYPDLHVKATVVHWQAQETEGELKPKSKIHNLLLLFI